MFDGYIVVIHVSVAMLVCLFAAMIISAFVAQHLILVSLSHYAPPHNTAFSNPAFQRFMGKYTPIRARLHHVIPCANCREQFARHGIFDFHNRVASRLTKPHICTPPYSGYDYLVAYLVWGMDKAMVETLGHGFLLDNNAEETTDVMHDPARVYVERAFCHGLPSTRLNSNNSNASLREMNNNNSNSSLNFQPESSDVPSDEYETVSENGESNDSMDYLTISQESTDSEGYHTAQNHPGSPTTSMNVHFVHNDDETTEDYTTFSVYTAHSVTTTDSFDDEGEEEEEEVEEERGDDNGVESPDTFTTASHYSSEYATPSCTGSEATQHGSENDTTEGQCGSDATKQESVGDKYLRVLTGLRDKMNSLKARRGKSCSSVNVGDSAMVNQLITESVREHMAISPGTMHTQHSSEPCGDISTNDTEESSNKSVSSCMLRAGSSPPFIPRKYDTMNKNNNGNTLNKGSKSSESNYNKLDEEANIEGCRMLDGPPDNKDGDTISITYDDPMPVECVFDEDDEGFPGQYCDGSSDSNDSNDGSLPNYIPSSPRNVSHLHSCGDNNLRKSNVKSSSSMLACHVASSTSVLSCPIISSSSEPSFFDRGDAQRPSIPPIPPPPGRLHNAAFKLIPPVVDVSSNPQNVTKTSYKPAEKQIPKVILPPLPVANFLLPNIGNPQNIRGEDYKENMQ